ncbi:MAG: DUF3562 domain-containing protein [Gammaproteobacteria bacterium]|nr:DUF3562 domain-containing protein [Gammaproteobacteria bacterium]MBV9726812.1 DUF3562 domain-containing protein [Gammaproteobacteria bacterium]
MTDANRTTHTRRSRDEATIAALAEETHTDHAVVHSLYEEELAALDAGSSVKNFIAVIAARRVKERLTAPPERTLPARSQAERRSHAA